MNEFYGSDYAYSNYNLFGHQYRYSLSAIGIKMRTRTFDSRRDAEKFMNRLCLRKNIPIECTESDKHEKTYSNNTDISFFINRIYY